MRGSHRQQHGPAEEPELDRHGENLIVQIDWCFAGSAGFADLGAAEFFRTEPVPWPMRGASPTIRHDFYRNSRCSPVEVAALASRYLRRSAIESTMRVRR